METRKGTERLQYSAVWEAELEQEVSARKQLTRRYGFSFDRITLTVEPNQATGAKADGDNGIGG